jgi:prepilin-type N-terminal cleavage/methylation domain-containing protein
MKMKKGFTLIELLLVIAILGILAAIVIVAVNPTKQLGDAKDAQRKQDVKTILDSVYQYSIDNSGSQALPGTLTTSDQEICKTGTLAATCTSGTLLNVSNLTDQEKYLVSIPVDSEPGVAATNGTGYYIKKTTNNRITVTSKANSAINATR